ncbi:MAG: 2OG-Fe(II) oxygenase [Xenococcaceae cyanobacterium]
MQMILNKYYSLKSKAFSLDYLKTLEKQILSCPYLSVNQLSDSFAGTKGFSVVFKRSGIEEVIYYFPFLQQYIKTALNSTCNAFDLNPLIIEPGTYVEPHIDCSISSYVEKYITPTIVSVLYIKVPTDLKGGELQLQKNDFKLENIEPKVNTLLYFRGNLKHSVSQVKSSEIRISLYQFTQRML